MTYSDPDYTPSPQHFEQQNPDQHDHRQPNHEQQTSSHHESLPLRTSARSVKRINRTNFLLLVNLLILIVFTIASFSFWSKTAETPQGNQPELLTRGQDKKPDALKKLPASYEKIQPTKRASLAFGETGFHRENSLPSNGSFEESAEIRRQSQLALKAREASVFFSLRSPVSPEETGKTRLFQGTSLTETETGSSKSQIKQSQIEHRLSALQNTFPETTDLLSGLSQNQKEDPGLQKQKNAFLNQKPDPQIYNPYQQQTPLSPYQLMAGTVISAALISGLDSDLPGQIMAQVTEHVYDTVTGRHLLIPQGARLIGKYDSTITYGQNRALITWHRLLLPNGTSVMIDQLPATDSGGFTGLQDEVDLHTGELLKGIVFATLLGIGTELSFGNNDNELAIALRQSAQSTTETAGQKIVKRSLDIQPTLKVRPGWPLRVIVNKDIILRPYTEAH